MLTASTTLSCWLGFVDFETIAANMSDIFAQNWENWRT